MGLLDKLFAKDKSSGESPQVEIDGAVSTLTTLYDDPEVRSERGISLTGPRANEVRAVGRRLHKGGGKERMELVRDRFREHHGWAAANLERIWSSMPEWEK